MSGRSQLLYTCHRGRSAPASPSLTPHPLPNSLHSPQCPHLHTCKVKNKVSLLCSSVCVVRATSRYAAAHPSSSTPGRENRIWRMRIRREEDRVDWVAASQVVWQRFCACGASESLSNTLQPIQ